MNDKVNPFKYGLTADDLLKLDEINRLRGLEGEGEC